MLFEQIVNGIGGFKIFPCHPELKSPLFEGWQELASNDPEQIEKWWTQYPDAIIGAPTGADNGFFVIDTDLKPEKNIDGEAMLQEIHPDIPETYTVLTRGKGLHRYYRWDDRFPVKTTGSQIGRGIDTRGVGGYVIIPPSEGWEVTNYFDGVISELREDMYAWVPKTTDSHLPAAYDFPEGSIEAFLVTQSDKVDPFTFKTTLDRIDVERMDVRDEWIKVIAAAVNASGKADWALEMITEWSLGSSPQYDKNGKLETEERRRSDIRRIWNSYHIRPGGAGFGTLRHIANEHTPYEPEIEEEEDDPVVTYQDTGGTIDLRHGMPAPQAGFRGPITWDIDQQLLLFDNYVYVTSTKQIHHIIYQNESYIADSFNTKFPGLFEKYESGQGRPIKDAWNAFKNLQFQPVRSIEFRPDLDQGVVYEDERNKGALPILNAYTPYNLVSKAGDASLWTDHIAKMIPDERDQSILHSWIAATVQYPGVKFDWAPLIQGVEGNGKSTILRVMRNLVGPMYSVSATSDKLESDFNGWMERRTFIGFDEVKLNNKYEVFERIKNYLTEPTLLVNEKNVKVDDKRIFFNMIFCTNHLDALPLSKNDRRIAPFICAQQTIDERLRDFPGDYFQNLNQWLDLDNHGEGIQTIAHFYLNYQIPDEFNPTMGVRNAPFTSSRDEIIERSLTNLAVAIDEIIKTNHMGMRGGWVNLCVLKAHLKGVAKFNDRTLAKALQTELGYIDRGRHRLVQGDATQTKLFSKEGVEATDPKGDYLEHNPALLTQINQAM